MFFRSTIQSTERFYSDTEEIKTTVTREKTNQVEFRRIALIPVNRYGCQSIHRGTDGDSLKKRRQLTQHCTIPPVCKGEKISDNGLVKYV